METRSTTSRLEEQLAAVLSKMDQQKEESDAQRTVLLKQMNAYSEQVQNLVQEQTARMNELSQKLTKADDCITAVEVDLKSVKDTVFGRLTAVEGSLSGLEARFCAEWEAKQEQTKQQLREELMLELTRTSLGLEAEGLRPTAAVFVPREIPTASVEDKGAATTTFAANGGTGSDSGGETGPRTRAFTTTNCNAGNVAALGTSEFKPQPQKPAPFDGKTPWDAYRAQFELLARINSWSMEEKATYLAISLRGAAATVLTTLSFEKQQNYESLVAALSSRFGSEHQSELNRVRLRTRSRRREETLPELAEDVERLVRLAYPEAAEPMVELLAKDQFVDALPEEDMRLRIHQNKPVTLQDALRIALELESYQLASKQRAKFVREAQLEEYPARQSRTEDSTQAVLQQILHAIERSGLEERRERRRFRRNTPPSGGREKGQSTVICWECQEKGHPR